MANPSDLLDDTIDQPSAKPSVADLLTQDDSGPARESVRLSQGIPQDKAAAVLKLRDATGLPTDFVSRNADALQKQADNAAITPQFSDAHPVTTSYMAEDTHHAALVGPDVSLLGSVERQLSYMGNQAERGTLDVERQFRGMLKGFGYQDASNEQRLTHIQQRLSGDLDVPAPGPVSNIFGKAIESTPQLAGALGIGAAAAFVGAPAAATTAATFGALEFGNAYLDYRNRRNSEGLPAMDDNTARGFAMLSGIGQAALFGSPVGKFIQKIPGLRVLSREGLSSLIESPTAMQAIKGFAAHVGEMGATMGGFSGLSALIHSASGRLAEMKSDGTLHEASPMTILTRMLPEEDLKVAAQSAASGAVTGGLFGSVTGGIDTASDFRNFTKSMNQKDLYYAHNYDQALKTAQGWTNISAALKSTKMAEIAPEQVDQLVNRMAPDNRIYIPVEHWQTYWEGQKTDPRAAFNEVVGNTTAYDEAMRTGTDLQIPASKYAAKIAPSDHADFFNNVLKSDPLAMSAEDAKSSTALTKQVEKEKADAAEKIKGDIAPNIPEPLPTPETEPITPAPEIKAVQDASDIQGIQPLFNEPEKSGMSKDLAGRYRRAIDEAHAKAKEDVARDIIDKELKQKSAAWNSERSEVEEQVKKDIDNIREYVAVDSFKKRIAPDGLKLSRLDADVIENEYGYKLNQLPDGVAIRNGGIHPDAAAARLGYESGSELIWNMLNLPSREKWIKEEADARMIDRHPEITEDNIVQKAMDAVHNKDRSKVLHLELKHLASDNFAAFKGLVRTIARKVPSIEEVRNEAEGIIANKITGETNPHMYQWGESTASREAQEFFLRGDFDKAFEAKKRELLNHELFRAAQDAKEESAKTVAFAKRFDRDSARARLGKAGADYLQQMDAIRSTFDFSRISGKDLEARQSLKEWVQDQKDAGFNPVIPEDLIEKAGKKSWRELTNDQLRTIGDSMRNIDNLARLKNKLLASQKERTMQEVREKIISTLDNRFKITPERLNEPYDENPSLGMKFRTKMNVAGAWLTRFEPLFKLVGLHDEFYSGINAAENFKTSEMRKSYAATVDMLKDYGKKERAQFGRITYIPELEGTGLSANRSKISILMSLLHAGNDGNMRELMRGYRLDESHLKAMWKTLSQKDIALANKVWDYVGSFRDAIGKQERDLNGIEPEWIEGRPFDVTLADGSVHHMNGGYFPLVYDRNVSFRTAALGQDEMAKDMFASYVSNTATKHNWTQARVGGGGQAPSLKWSVFTNHIADVIHDLAYRKPVIDLHRLINDEEIRPHLQAGLGKGVYAELNPWIKRIAGDRQWTPLGPLELLRTVSNNMTFAELGIKVGSALVHMTSVLPAARETGLGYMAQGFKTFLQPEKATKFMWDSSEFMRARWEDAGDRDIRNAESNPDLINVHKGFLNELRAMSPIQQRDAFVLMRAADISIAGPTWYAAYYKAMDGKVKDIDAHEHEKSVAYADSVVRDYKGSGAIKDIAPYQSYGGQVGKLFTMFQTQLNVIANQMMNEARDVKVTHDYGKLSAGVMATWIGPAIAAQLLRGHFPGDDEGWLKWGMKATAEFPFEVNPVTQPFVRFMENPKDPLTLLPVEEALTTVGRTAHAMITKNPIADSVTGDQSEWTPKDYQNAFMSIGYLKGIPTRQIMQSTLRLSGWMSGEEEHKNALGGIYSVLTGSKPK